MHKQTIVAVMLAAVPTMAARAEPPSTIASPSYRTASHWRRGEQ